MKSRSRIILGLETLFWKVSVSGLNVMFYKFTIVLLLPVTRWPTQYCMHAVHAFFHTVDSLNSCIILRYLLLNKLSFNMMMSTSPTRGSCRWREYDRNV